jgi:hypothetical protein
MTRVRVAQGLFENSPEEAWKKDHKAVERQFSAM